MMVEEADPTARAGGDALGWRAKLGVVAPSTNTIVQPDFDRLRPDGVTNQQSRALIPNVSVESDGDFLQLMELVRGATDAAVDALLSCEPDHIVLGMSAETFWDGPDAANSYARTLEKRCHVGVTLGSTAILEALRVLGGAEQVAIITPYMPVGDERVRQFFIDSGMEITALKGLKCRSPVAIAQVPEVDLRKAIIEVNSTRADAIIQVGTNLSMLGLAAEAEIELGKPVIAINAATYWYALRSLGIDDRIAGLGTLMSEH